jgi:Flp pilus assembly protein TadD
MLELRKNAGRVRRHWLYPYNVFRPNAEETVAAYFGAQPVVKWMAFEMEERRKIIDLVKAMEKDGKVSFRQRGKVQTLDGDEMGVGLAAHRMSAAHNDPVQAYNAGVAAMEQGNIEEAVTEFEVCVQLNPQSVEGYQGLANALYGAGRYPEALAAYDMLLSLQPNPELQSWVEQLRASLSAAA